MAGKRITVMGLGVHGGAEGAIRWLASCGARVTVTDLKSREELSETLTALHDLTEVTWVLGEHRESDFTDTDMVIRNPAVPRQSPFLTAARSAGVPVEMDSSLFFKYVASSNVIGVTGSKGKTTTASVIGQLLRLKFPRVHVIGTEGTSPLGSVSEVARDDVAVFELSSWRLEGMDEHGLSPRTAVVTSLYRDHLNTYESYEEYVDAKRGIVRHQAAGDRALLNYDDEEVRSFATDTPARVFWYSLGNSIPGAGICVRKGRVIIETDNPVTGSLDLFSVDALPFVSDHERRNALPGIYLAWCNGVRPETIKLHLNQLQTPAHRLEQVGVVKNVTYINDSAATIPDATLAAVRSLYDRHLVLILGGSDKRLRFEDLAEALPHMRIRGIVFLPGTATDTMRAEIESRYRVPPRVEQAHSMREAVSMAQGMAHEYDVVLLSPGATSFGLFKHEFDRGDKFKEAVSQMQ